MVLPRPKTPRRAGLKQGIAALAFAVTALCAVPEPLPASEFEDLAFTDQRPYLWDEEVPEDELKDIRGGVLLANGYILDFAIETVTMVDGIVQAQSVLSATVSDEIIQTLAAASTSSITQIGNGNVLPQELNDQLTSIITVVQNSKPQTDISQLTNADFNLRAVDVDAALNAALRSAIDLQSAGLN